MTELRHLTAAVLALMCLQALPVAGATAVADGLESTRSLARTGAVQLAFHRIDTLQPVDAAAPRWAEWELLRMQLLAAAGRHENVLQRVAVLPAGVNMKSRTDVHILAAQSALELGQGATARDYAGRALWASDISAAQARELRLLVIGSHVRDSHGDDAYRSMLRFQQDYRPLDKETAAVFVNGLLDSGKIKEAVSWLGLLEERSVAKLRLRLHTGLIEPQEAANQARTAFARSADPLWWQVLLEAGERLKSGELRIEALEHLLDVKKAPVVDAKALWGSYVSYAREAANSHQLLAGDDLNWMEFAMRGRDRAPVIARAYFAYLARHARGQTERQQAQEQLAAAFAKAKLSRAALRLYAEGPGDPVALSAATRHTLGALAEGVAEHEQALRFWLGLPAPAGTSATDWNLQLAALALRAGRAGVAADIARQLTTAKAVIPQAQLPAWIVLAQQFGDHGQHDGAQILFEHALLYADAAQARVVLAGIARLHESRKQPLLAADYYLRAAQRASGPDAAAAEARLQAGLNLARAGLLSDARTQFEWVLKNARDPVQIAIARRELGF